MSSPEFAYRPVLEELTGVVDDRGLDPFEAYAWLYERQLELGLTAEAYCSTAITSGGHARDDSLEMTEIVARNTVSAKMLAEQLAHDQQIAPSGAVEPVFVGKTHWNQKEFMEFWLAVIGGYSLGSRGIARKIDALRVSVAEYADQAGLDAALMVSHERPEVRAGEYFRLAEAFAHTITSGMDARPIPTVVRMIDTHMSLGAQTERIFARRIGSKVMNISVVRPASCEDLAVVNHRLAQDTQRLIGFGATIFDMSQGVVRLQLTEDEAA